MIKIINRENDIPYRIELLKERIAKAAIKSGRKSDDILLVAVTKTHSPEKIDCALANGINHFGENKVQEAVAKLPLLKQPYIGFHFIGHLQTNKVKALLNLKPWLIHSVDSYYLAEYIQRTCLSNNMIQDILLQINTTGEESKTGIPPDVTVKTTKEIAMLSNIRIKGLMTIGKFDPNPETNKPYFQMVVELAKEIDKLGIENVRMQWLSMGMTDDFEVAIECGSNLVRIGSAIFGARNYK